jgi:U3 small nucleolar RNA-associated protein 5
MRKLKSLYRVVDDRAKSLQALLMLKGKLDMLDAQTNLRKSMQAQSRARNALEEDDEEGVTYVEGQEESDSEDEEEEEDTVPDSRPAKAGAEVPELSAAEGSDVSNEDDDDNKESEDGMPTTTNGVIAESNDSESDEEGLSDEEASSTDHESRDEDSEDEVDHESIDSVDSSDADTSPPPKHPAKKSKLSNGISSRKR